MTTLKRTEKMVFKTNYHLMQVKSIAECSAILLTCIKLPIVIKILVLSIFEWPFYTGFTVHLILSAPFATKPSVFSSDDVHVFW